MNTQDFNLARTEAIEPEYKDYEAGMAAAKAAGKPVMIDFTGFGCVNCRKMEAAVWTDEDVKKTITEDYVLIQLFVDDKTPLPEPIEVVENGQPRKLRTVGDRWSYFQRTKFGSNTQPFYVLLDNEGHALNSSYSYDEDIKKYTEFLQKGKVMAGSAQRLFYDIFALHHLVSTYILRLCRHQTMVHRVCANHKPL